MRRPGCRDLVPLRAAAGSEVQARTEARLRNAWLLVVGPALVHHTRLLRVHRGVLVVGCWHPQIIPNLRKSAEAVWPQVQERLRRMWKLEFRSMDIIPCDPPEPTAPAKPREPDALKAVLRANGLDYVEDGAVIRVDDASKLNQEKVERETANARTLELVPLETRIVKLNYANAAEMAPPLQPGLSKRGSIQVERRTNSLIVTDLASNLDGVVKMAMDLDSTTPQIEITAKLVDVDESATNSLGIEGFLHGGHTYTYFGVWPSLIRMPFLAVSHALDGKLTAPSLLAAWLLTASRRWRRWASDRRRR